MNQAVPVSAAGKPLEVWFQDEARVGQKGWIPYQWAPIGSRPPAVRDNRHDSVYMFGAICPDREVGAAIIMPAANTEAMNQHLAEISTQVQPNAHAVLICDGAGWHQRGKKLKVPDNITLIPLPPATLLTGTQLDGECLALPPRQQTEPAGVAQLRRHRRRMQGRVGFSDQ